MFFMKAIWSNQEGVYRKNCTLFSYKEIGLGDWMVQVITFVTKVPYIVYNNRFKQEYSLIYLVQLEI